ncbi:MAG: hypothetical protein ABSH03_01495 [Candidatus Lustribacter sp.]
MDIPKPGDIIYVETDLYVGHGVDDFRGGKARVAVVRMGDSTGLPLESGCARRTCRGKQVPWVEVVENPGTSYNWELLAEQQAKLATEFGDVWAHAAPDLRPQFNNNDGLR